jgi:class 3 adenylate cyclase
MSTVERADVVAGRHAFAQHDWEQAYELLAVADAEDSLDGADLERLAEAAAWSRRFDDELRFLERAQATHHAGGDPRAAGRVAMKLAQAYWTRGNDAQTGGWFGRAYTLLEGDDESHEGGMLLWMTVRAVLLSEGDADKAIPLAERLVALARRLGDPDLEALGLLELAHSLIISGRVSEGSRLLDEANAIAGSEATELYTAGTVYCSTIFACRNIGDWSRASEWTERSLAWCERNSVSGFPGLCRLHRAEVIRFRGSLEEAERDARAACEELAVAFPRMAGHAFHELGDVLRRRGELDGARAAFAKALEFGFDPQPGLARLRLDEGDPAGALLVMSRALADRDVFTQEARALLLLPAQVTIALAAREHAKAADALGELEQAAEECGTAIFTTSATQARGEVALAAGDPERAVPDLRAAWRGWCDAGAPYEAAEVRTLLGRAYQLAGDVPAATLEFEGARDAFERLGARTGLRGAENLLADIRGGSEVRETRTFMFTDIVDSTRPVELLGDESWTMLLSWHDRALRSCFADHDGAEINQEGDGFFVAFPTADAALRCAQSVQRNLNKHRAEHGFAPQIRIGLHSAEATSRGGDYSGRGVHTAARVAAAAGAGEIVASGDTLAAAADRYEVAEPRAVALKGLAEPVELVTVRWT